MTTLIKTFLTRWFFRQTCLLDTIQLADRCQTPIPLWDPYLVDTRRMESIQLRDFPVAPSSSLTLCHIKVCWKSVLSFSLLIIIRHVYFFFPLRTTSMLICPPTVPLFVSTTPADDPSCRHVQKSSFMAPLASLHRGINGLGLVLFQLLQSHIRAHFPSTYSPCEI